MTYMHLHVQWRYIVHLQLQFVHIAVMYSTCACTFISNILCMHVQF